MTLADLRKIAEAATPGPWKQRERFSRTVETPRQHNPVATAERIVRGVADAVHIATFDPPTVLALLDVAEAAVAFVRADDDWESIGDDERWNSTSSDLRAALARLEGLG